MDECQTTKAKPKRKEKNSALLIRDQRNHCHRRRSNDPSPSTRRQGESGGERSEAPRSSAETAREAAFARG